MEADIKLKQPKGLWLLSFTAIWERFSYYGMRAILVLYVANDALNPANRKAHLGGLGLPENSAGWIYSNFTMMCYLLPLLGGIVADKYLGKRRSVIVGGLFIMFGHFTMAADINFYTFITGLSLLAIGNGFFKPSAPSMIGDLYEQGDPRRDSGFTLYYTLFNGGAFFAPLICGYFGETYAYRYGFLTAGIAMAMGLIVYSIYAQRFLGEIGKFIPKPKTVDANAEIKKAPLTKEEKDRISVILVLMFFVTFFWAGFEQAGSTFTLYTDKFLDKTIFGWEMPTSWLQAVNPVFIVILGPLFSMLWVSLAKKKKNPSSPIKMGIGMISLAVGFLFMIGAVLQRGNSSDIAIKASILWMIATYLFHTIGELCLSPIGLSMVSKLAPLKMASLFMGIWFLSSAAANYASGLMIIFANTFGYMALFTMFAVVVGVLGIVVFLISRWLLNRMHGRD
jgi:proton-dependent oligopeptide transporter, POT family